jgi:hypothetical protein
MQTDIPCSCKDTSTCGGRFTTAEVKMNELNPEMSVQKYHEVLDLFEKAFDMAN